MPEPSASFNHFMMCLSVHDRALIEPHLHSAELVLGHVLHATHEPVKQVYFPRSGMASLVVPFADGRWAEAAVAGPNTVVGAGAALGDKIAVTEVIVQIAGAADRIETAILKRCAQMSETLRERLARHEQALGVQAMQIAGCNAVHSLEQRLCRWLLQCRDVVRGETIPLTHDFLSAMLGVQRASLTLIAGKLQADGLISYRRGQIQILDVDGLIASSCECYRTMRQETRRLIGWPPPEPSGASLSRATGLM